MRTLLLALLLGVAAGAGLTLAQLPSAAEPPVDALWSRFHYQLLDATPDGDFDLVIPVDSGKNGEKAGAAGKWDNRIVLGYRDKENYTVLTLRDGAAKLAEVESGLAFPRAKALLPPPQTLFAVGGGVAQRLCLRWRRPYATLLAAGRAVLRAELPDLPAGRAGVGLGADGVAFARPVLHPAPPILYTDDFMRNPHEASPWTSPDAEAWEVRSHDNPSRSANAFVYQCRSRTGSVSLVGTDRWDAYRAAVSLHGPVGGAGGLVFHARAPDDCFILRWGARRLGLTPGREEDEDSPGNVWADMKEEERPPLERLQLLRRTPAGDAVLIERDGGVRPFQWHRLEVVAADGRAECRVDGRTVFRVEHPDLYGGRAGLFAHGVEAVEFDDFQVRSFAGRLPEVVGGEAVDLSTETPSESAPDSSPDVGTESAPGPGPGPARNNPAANPPSAGLREADRAGGRRTPQGASTSAADRVLYGRPSWRGYRMTTHARLAPPGADGVRLAAYAVYRDPLDCARILVRRGDDGADRLVVERIDGDPASAEILAGAGFAGAAPDEGALAVTLDRGILAARYGGGPTVYACLPAEAAAGRCGVGGVTVGRCGPVRVRPLEPPVPAASVNQVFDEEQMMKAWSGAAGDWVIRDGGKAYDGIAWHRCLFFGDMELELALPELAARGRNREVALSIAKPIAPDPDKKRNGYTLRFLPDRASGEEWGEEQAGTAAPVLELIRDGESVATETLDPEHLPRRLRLRQAGPFVLVNVDDERRIAWRDPEPLAGRKIAWAVRGLAIDPAGARVASRSMRNYLFSSAPVDWRIGAGVWEVTNRWECDPRWNFWSGMPPRLARLRAETLERFLSDEAEWKAANLRRQFRLLPDAGREPGEMDRHTVLWHKAGFEGDMMLDVYVAQMMDNSRGGGGYKNYVRDFNVTIAADGEHLASGYSCLFGGWGNRRSAIVRAGEAVVVKDVKLPLSGSHRRWVRLHVERRGDTIRFDAYNERHPRRPEQTLLSLTYKDPDPLTGKRVAIWSYDNGILVTRARLSAERITPAEDPFALHPAHVRSVYTSDAADAEKEE